VLVLRRMPDEKILVTVGDTVVTVTFLAVKGGRAVLGFEAPDHVQIDREEVHIARRDQAKRINHDRPAPSQGSAGNPGGL
jgi:carbon storage regulator CsrA